MVSNDVIKYILVVGFHHKRGSEVEFIYPVIDNKENDLMKRVPHIAMPDGAHKTSSDTFYFIIPKFESNGIYFGVACYRQVLVDHLKDKKPEDVTRNSIQKSIVMLSEKPFYGSIAALLSGVADSYFESTNFANNKILIETYNQINNHFKLIAEDLSEKGSDTISQCVNENLSVSDLIVRFEHDILVLLKLILLQKKIIFFMEPISKATETIVTLLSLFQGVLTSDSIQKCGDYIYEEGEVEEDNTTLESDDYKDILEEKDIIQTESNKSNVELSTDNIEESDTTNSNSSWLSNIKHTSGQVAKFIGTVVSSGDTALPSDGTRSNSQNIEKSVPLPPFTQSSNSEKIEFVNNNIDKWGFPLCLFDEEHVVVPYASIGFLSILTNKKIHAFLMGANNHLWKFKSSQYDVMVVEDKYAHLIYSTPQTAPSAEKTGFQAAQSANNNLTQRLVTLTAADRRFADYLLHVVKRYNRLQQEIHIPSTSTKVGSEESIDQNFQQHNSVRSSQSNPNIGQVENPEQFDESAKSTDDVSSIEVGELVEEYASSQAAKHREEQLPEFTDIRMLEVWLRNAITDYIKSMLYSATGKGNRMSFEDFGFEFMQNIQVKNYFKTWYFSIDEPFILNSRTAFFINNQSEASLTLNLSQHLNDNNQSDNNHSSSAQLLGDDKSCESAVPAYTHPGRLIQPKLGDHLPGYYQIRNYAGQSKALVNKSVHEIKKFGSDRGSQIKSQMSAGFTKLSGLARAHGAKLSTTWWGQGATSTSPTATQVREVAYNLRTVSFDSTTEGEGVISLDGDKDAGEK